MTLVPFLDYLKMITRSDKLLCFMYSASFELTSFVFLRLAGWTGVISGDFSRCSGRRSTSSRLGSMNTLGVSSIGARAPLQQTFYHIYKYTVYIYKYFENLKSSNSLKTFFPGPFNTIDTASPPIYIPLTL